MDAVGDIHMDGQQPRLQLRQFDAEHLIDIALNEIRQSAGSNVSVLLRLLRLTRQLLERTSTTSVREHLQHHACLVAEQCRRSVPETADRDAIENAFRRTVEAKPVTAEKC